MGWEGVVLRLLDGRDRGTIGGTDHLWICARICICYNPCPNNPNDVVSIKVVYELARIMCAAIVLPKFCSEDRIRTADVSKRGIPIDGLFTVVVVGVCVVNHVGPLKLICTKFQEILPPSQSTSKYQLFAS